MQTTRPLRRTHRPARPKPQTGFPGEASWQWHVQLSIERVISPLRVASLAATGAAWAAIPHPAAASPWLVRDIMVFTGIYCIADTVLVYRFPRLVSRTPWGSTVLDLILILGWIAATGGSNSPFLGLAMLGAVSAPLRNPAPFAAAISAAYAAGVLALAGAAHWFDALYLLAAGLGLTIWNSSTNRDRRNSLRDELTGCFSREYAMFRLDDVFAERALPVAVAVVDLDGFKHVNDMYGHGAGDAILVQVVRVISATIRQGDLLARTGGDELLLVLPETDAATASAIADRMRVGIAEARFHSSRELPVIRLTASIGIAVASRPTSDYLGFIGRADERLYEAKEAGRNRVVV